ncbi:MAG: NUDIX domain-containing protein [Hyphomicrobium sp.]|uniref:NUDIX hydrolase n=1 Tax=Hyphomicrobium sp. TaxID=82 RepID=UPI001325F3BF|nr:NUDIX domain-containing protein [Hyphomicrobium sp.]KAB2939007.1 MAG: NUDIX domain-containing protein [Hyphomicrobium sp.]MBZ0211765.1 NUDIX domain-containing protein [Hyphomicrobium sp.]
MHINALPSLISGVADRPSTASAAIITTEDGGLLLQHRDDIPGIWFPNYWGLFGGAIDEGEDPGAALVRELEEELGFRPREVAYFTQVCFDLRRWNLGIRLRYIFTVASTREELSTVKLNEGQAAKLFSKEDVFSVRRLTPYDAFALRLWMAQADLKHMPSA